MHGYIVDLACRDVVMTNLPPIRRAKLQWEAGKPKNVLLIKKPNNAEATERLLQIGEVAHPLMQRQKPRCGVWILILDGYLILLSCLPCETVGAWLEARGLVPMVEPSAHDDELQRFQPFSRGEHGGAASVDFCITLGVRATSDDGVLHHSG